jgi:myo-inositol-1(or 4)-monophosphatase
VGIEYKGHVWLGGIYNPLQQELFFAQKGRGTFLNGRRVHVSQTKRLLDSLLVTGFPYDRRKKADFYLHFFRNFMQRTQGIRRLGAAALDLAYVACGRFDAFWEFNLKAWDLAAGVLMVEEAGGKVTDFAGKRLALDRPQQLLSSNGLIHSRLLKEFNRAFSSLRKPKQE